MARVIRVFPPNRRPASRISEGMPRIAPFAALAALALTLPTPVAATPPGRTCHLLRKGDRHAEPVADRPIVITSADLASDQRYLTAVIRVMDAEGPADALLTKGFTFYFSVSTEESYYLAARVTPVGAPRFWLGWIDQPFDPDEYNFSTGRYLTGADGVVDTVRDEVRMSVPMSVFRLFKTGVRHGATVTYLGAQTGKGVGLPDDQVQPGAAVLTNGDWVYGKRTVTYRLGRPSCVTPGR